MKQKETDSTSSSPFNYGSLPAHYEEGFNSLCAGVVCCFIGLASTSSDDDTLSLIWQFLCLLSWAFLLIGFLIPGKERRGKYWAFILFRMDIISGFIWGEFIILAVVIPIILIGILFKLLFFTGGEPW